MLTDLLTGVCHASNFLLYVTFNKTFRKAIATTTCRLKSNSVVQSKCWTCYPFCFAHVKKVFCLLKAFEILFEVLLTYLSSFRSRTVVQKSAFNAVVVGTPSNHNQSSCELIDKVPKNCLRLAEICRESSREQSRDLQRYFCTMSALKQHVPCSLVQTDVSLEDFQSSIKLNSTSVFECIALLRIKSICVTCYEFWCFRNHRPYFHVGLMP